MNKFCKIVLAAAAVTALAAPAMAADKLIVKHTSGADAFKVDDNGKITEYTEDAGTNTELEYARYERSSTGTPAVGFGAKRSVALKLGASSTVAQEQVLKWSGLTAGAEQSDFIIRNYASGSLRDAFAISAQPFFYRWLRTGVTYSTPQAAGTFFLKKGGATMSDGTGPRVAFSADDNTGTTLTVGSISFPVDFTNSRSSVAFTVRNSSADTFAAFEALRVTYDGKLALGTTAPTSKIHVVGLPLYDTVGAATAAGLTSGAVFRTSGNVLMIVP